MAQKRGGQTHQHGGGRVSLDGAGRATGFGDGIKDEHSSLVELGKAGYDF